MSLIPSALQPAEVEQVLLCDMIGRAIVLVKDDQLSQAIGKFGQNVRLGSKLVGWDIEIMTAGELEEQIDRAVGAFMELEGMTDDLAQRLVEQGYLSYDDLSVIEPDALMDMGEMTEEQVDAIVEQADVRALEAEQIAEEQKRLKKEQEQLAAQNAAAAPPKTSTPAAAEPASAEVQAATEVTSSTEPEVAPTAEASESAETTVSDKTAENE